jgi:hypothetical protein
VAEAGAWEANDDPIQHRTRGFLPTRHQGETYTLLQTRVEPGCVGEVQFGPPSRPRFLPQPGLALLSDSTQSELGGRSLMRSKRAVLRSTFVNVDLRSPISRLGDELFVAFRADHLLFKTYARNGCARSTRSMRHCVPSRRRLHSSNRTAFDGEERSGGDAIYTCNVNRTGDSVLAMLRRS